MVKKIVKKKDSFGDSYRYPCDIDESTWFYVSKSGKTIEFVRQVRDKQGEIITTDMFNVRVSRLLNKLAKCRR